MRVAKAISLTDEQRGTLTKWSRGRSTPARLVLRAKIVLAAAEGRENKDVAAELGCTRRTVGTWRNRFAEHGLTGIEQDAPRGGRTPAVRSDKEAEIIRKTTQETPPNATQWSTRSMARAAASPPRPPARTSPRATRRLRPLAKAPAPTGPMRTTRSSL